MPLLVEICAVVATLAMVAVAVAAIRAMNSVTHARVQFTRLTDEVHQWMVQVNALTLEARETMVSLRDVVAPIRRVADRFEALGERTASLSAAVLGEIEPPVHNAVLLARAVRSGATFLLERLSHRFAYGRSATNGGSGQ